MALETTMPNFLRSDKYGPNTPQVERFIELVAKLTPAERDSVLEDKREVMAAYGSSDTHFVQAEAMSAYGSEHEKMLESASTALRKAAADIRGELALSAGAAVMGLVFCDVMSPAEFATWYGSFARTIPVESLGKGLAPSVRPPPALPWQRFLTRVHSLEAPDWQGVVGVREMLLRAHGNEPLDRALDATRAVVNTPEQDRPIADSEVTALGDALEEIATIGEDYQRRWEGVLGTMESSLQQEDSGDSEDRSAGFENLKDHSTSIVSSFRRCCKQGLVAVAFQGLVDDEHIYYLYVPFEAFIPLRDLG